MSDPRCLSEPPLRDSQKDLDCPLKTLPGYSPVEPSPNLSITHSLGAWASAPGYGSVEQSARTPCLTIRCEYPCGMEPTQVTFRLLPRYGIHTAREAHDWFLAMMRKHEEFEVETDEPGEWPLPFCSETVRWVMDYSYSGVSNRPTRDNGPDLQQSPYRAMRGSTFFELDGDSALVCHPLVRRAWATRRKHLPVQDVMAAGGWRDVNALQKAYQASDPETVRKVMELG